MVRFASLLFWDAAGDVGEQFERVLRHVFQSCLSEPSAASWPGVHLRTEEKGVTAFHALCAFASEERYRCEICDTTHVRCVSDGRLVLPPPSARCEWPQTLTHGYLQSCAPVSRAMACFGESCCGRDQPHEVQRRMLHLPDMLLVAVSRGATADGDAAA